MTVGTPNSPRSRRATTSSPSGCWPTKRAAGAHGARTTFVRVADVVGGAGRAGRRAAGGRRSADRGRAGRQRAAAARSGSGRGGGTRCRSPAFRWPISSSSRAASASRCARCSRSLRAAGLELVAEAPFDRLQDRRRSIEEVNIAGLALARLTIHQLPSSEVPALLNDVVDAAAGRRRDPRVRAAAAAGESRRADHRLRRCQAGRAGAALRRRTFRRFRSTGRSTVRSWRRWR